MPRRKRTLTSRESSTSMPRSSTWRESGLRQIVSRRSSTWDCASAPSRGWSRAGATWTSTPSTSRVVFRPSRSCIRSSQSRPSATTTWLPSTTNCPMSRAPMSPHRRLRPSSKRLPPCTSGSSHRSRVTRECSLGTATCSRARTTRPWPSMFCGSRTSTTQWIWTSSRGWVPTLSSRRCTRRPWSIFRRPRRSSQRRSSGC
mmetsp:Transcript_14679/g.29000  ORF Transcript_14679/g.29000 Transcript_14679/m.29000 type:complete len:201 (+) Transcript_14679:240-842(+)